MIRAVGTVLVSAGCAWMGFQASEELKKRQRTLRDMAQALERMEYELELGAPPLERLLDRGACGSQEPVSGLLRACARGLEHLAEEPLPSLWRRLVLEAHELGREGQQALIPLGAALGRYGGRAQQEELRAVRQRLEELARRQEEEQRRQGRVYRALGLSGGAVLAILLL